jgi:hypothetical protein
LSNWRGFGVHAPSKPDRSLASTQSVSSRESHNIQISQTHPIIEHIAKMIHTYRPNNQR